MKISEKLLKFIWFKSVKTNNIERIKLIIDCGIDIDIQNEFGSTGLIVASNYGILEVVEMLLNNGVNPFIKNEDAETALNYAKIYNHQKIVELLESYSR